MKHFQTGKRLVALLLSLVMVLGLLPVTALAAEDTTHYLLFATDRHGNDSIIGSVLSNVKADGADVEYVGLGGDMVDGQSSYNTSTVQGEVTAVFSNANVDITQGSHDSGANDDAKILCTSSGLIETGEDYYVYGVTQSDMESVSSAQSAAAAFVNWANGDDVDASKVIIVLSHMPIHAKRGDNSGAGYWHNALNTVASNGGTEVVRNVIFFHGHNHTVDITEYFYNVGETLSVESYVSANALRLIADDVTTMFDSELGTYATATGTSSTIYYTYATAGYLNDKQDATLVAINDDTITLTKYNTVGSEELGTVTRVGQAASNDDADESAEGSESTENTEGTENTESTEGSDNTESTVPAPTTATVTGATATEEKTVYVLVSTPTAGNQYLIVSTGAAGSGYALKENINTGSSITINPAVDGISAPWIETSDETIMWNTASGMTFQSENDGYYLRMNNRRSLNFSTSQSTNWTAGTNYLFAQNGNSKYYVRCSSGTWSVSTDSNSVYFYEKQTVTVTTSANGTYSIAGDPAEVAKVVVNGTTATLGSTLTFAPESGAATTKDTSTEATYTVYSDPNGIISGISGNTVTFTGNYGEAMVKVSYTITVNGTPYTVDNYIVVAAKEPTYEIEITKDDEVVTDVIVVKDVTDSTTLQLGKVVTYETANGTETITPADDTIEWEVSDETIATVDQNGLVTFKGVTGIVNVTVSYKVAEGKYVTDTIAISANTANYSTPSDGTNDFPEYPNEGAVRFDKHATAVGSFSQTGITQVELSMTGVPYTTGSEIDVVLMLDMTGSMSDNDMIAAEEAAIVFAESIVKNEDGTYNNNRVAVYAFNIGSSGSSGSKPGSGSSTGATYELWSMGTITADTWSSFCTAVRTASNNQKSGGTPYSYALSKCKDVLDAAKTDGIGDNRQQFCVFVSDGEPTSYTDVDGGSSTSKNEYYSTQMKNDGVTIYTVGTGISEGSTAAGILERIASDSEKAYIVESSSDQSGLNGVFSSIGTEIKQAATNVTVTDKIADDYTMIFDIPETVDANNLPEGQEFFIEVVQYTLDANKERTDEVVTLEKIYLETINGVLTATDGNGNALEGVTVTGSGDTLKIDSVYFTYDASTRILVWKADKLDTTELALRYFLYLDGSIGFDPEHPEYAEAGTYETNDYAYIDYTNHLGNECRQEFPVPQMTWNGAQVSYVFYLVNEQGQPVNRAGRVVPFAEAVYVTDVHTISITWNDMEQTTSLNADLLAKDLVPSVYSLYDATARYTIHVFEDETGADLNNHFKIEGATNTTYVFNAKSDARKYTAAGIYAADATYKCKEYTEDGMYEDEIGKYNIVTKTDATAVATGFDFANTTVAFAVVWKPELAPDSVVIDFGLPVVIDVATNDALSGGVVGVRKDAPANIEINKGQFTAGKASSATLAHGVVTVENLNAVRYTPTDTLLNAPETFYYESEVSYYNGDTLTSVNMYSSVTVIPATTIYYEDNFLSYTDSGAATETSGKWSAETSTDKTQDADRPGAGLISAALDADNVYGYDSAYTHCATFSQGASRYVTVDATTGAGDAAPTAEFTFTGTAFDIISVTDNTTGTILVDIYNAADKKIDALIVDTYYGYNANQATGDEAYKVITWKYSNGAWHIAETAYAATAGESGQPSINPAEGETFVVYEKNIEWTVSANDPNALYQIPVIKADLGTYGTYTVKITVQYLSALDHNKDGSYTFYLDAIRIFNPAQGNAEAESAYALDGEGWPEYKELRDLLISANAFDTAADSVNGAVFIDGFGATDSVSDYADVGPNNEVYLAKGQAVAFQLSNSNAANLASVQLALKAVNGSADYTVTTANGKTLLNGTAATATDLYYKLDGLTWANGVSDTIIITNTGEGILSITNLKFTYQSAPAATTDVVTSKAAASAAVYAVRALLLPEAKYFAPENLSVKLSKSSVSKGAFVTVTVTTSVDVASVTVNGNKVVRCTTNSRNGTKVWRATVMATEVGVQKISVVAYDADGLASYPEIARLTVHNGRVIWWKSAFGLAD